MRSTPWWGQIKAREFCSRAEHVQTAERLAKEHGILRRGWLQRNGFAALSSAIHSHPEWFSHIPQKQKGKKSRPSEHVQTAERLAKEHGMIPNPNWLRNNGFDALCHIWRYVLNCSHTFLKQKERSGKVPPSMSKLPNDWLQNIMEYRRTTGCVRMGMRLCIITCVIIQNCLHISLDTNRNLKHMPTAILIENIARWACAGSVINRNGMNGKDVRPSKNRGRFVNLR